MHFTIGMTVLAIIVLVVFTEDGWANPGAGSHLTNASILLAVAAAIEGFRFISDSDGTENALRVVGHLVLGAAIVALVFGAVKAKKEAAGGAPAASEW